MPQMSQKGRISPPTPGSMPLLRVLGLKTAALQKFRKEAGSPWDTDDFVQAA